MEWLSYMLVAMAVLVISGVAMSVGMIFRGKTFTSCGRAARDFDGQPIECAACGQRVQGEGKACQRKAAE
jgi:hypothetical protein